LERKGWEHFDKTGYFFYGMYNDASDEKIKKEIMKYGMLGCLPPFINAMYVSWTISTTGMFLPWFSYVGMHFLPYMFIFKLFKDKKINFYLTILMFKRLLLSLGMLTGMFV